MAREPLPLQPYEGSFEDFFNESLSGHLIVTPNGTILRANRRLTEWLGRPESDITGKRVSDFLSIGGRMLYETHLWPLMRMTSQFAEVSLELLAASGERIATLANGYERRRADGTPELIILTFYKAEDRRLYEKTLKDARDQAESALSSERQLASLREQFIAVLGHDLRNPLGAIMGGLQIFSRILTGDRELKLIKVMEQSSRRMEELIANVMDFARTRLGGGMSLDLHPVMLEPVVTHTVEELKTFWPDRVFNISFDIPHAVICDKARIAQLLSNLIANALTHGAKDSIIGVSGAVAGDSIELSVTNKGLKIPDDILKHLFEPYTREDKHTSQNGLGLGLFIASEIAKSHNGQLKATSTDTETRFTFKMPIA